MNAITSERVVQIVILANQTPQRRDCRQRVQNAFARAGNYIRETDTRIHQSILDLYEQHEYCGLIAATLYLPTFVREMTGALRESREIRLCFGVSTVVWMIFPTWCLLDLLYYKSSSDRIVLAD